MSTVNTSITKQPLKMIEVPLIKFKEEVIPHHQKIFEQHKPYMLKLIAQGNVATVQQEVKNKKKVVKQLKDLMYELDTLRTQVENEDLDKFDTKTLSLRKAILNLVTGYSDLEKKSKSLISEHEEKKMTLIVSPFENSPQIQLQENINDIKLKQHEEILREVEGIQRDAEDLNEMYCTLNQMVGEQRQPIEHIEESVESTNTNVNSGLKQLIKAHKLKTASYPIFGAALGTIVGGPIGMVAGLKVGGLASLGCAIVGYTGGRFFKKTHDIEDVPAEESNESADLNDSGPTEKKDI